MAEEKVSAQELFKMDPEKMTTEQFTQMKNYSDRMNKARDIEMKTYEKDVAFLELQAREFKATRDQKVFNLENMKATIEMEGLFDKYQETLNIGRDRMAALQAKQAEEDAQEKEKASQEFADSLL